MKTKLTLICGILAVFTALSLTGCHSEHTYGDFEYHYGNYYLPGGVDYGARTIVITGYTGSGGAVTIPSKIGIRTVVAIGNGAFYSNRLTGVTIPNSVTVIGDSAFLGNKLTSVTIGNSVTTIGDEAFYNNLLTSVTIPNSVTTIEGSAFSNNPLTSITIGANVSLEADITQGTETLLRNSLPGNFVSVYNNGGKQAGTYIFTGTVTEAEQWGNVYFVHTGSWSKGGSGGGGTHDIDSSLYGTWSTSNGALTVTFSSGGVTWGGTVGNALNIQGATWTAKNGNISYSYAGTSSTAFTYTMSSGNLVLTSSSTSTQYTLSKS